MFLPLPYGAIYERTAAASIERDLSQIKTILSVSTRFSHSGFAWPRAVATRCAAWFPLCRFVGAERLFWCYPWPTVVEQLFPRPHPGSRGPGHRVERLGIPSVRPFDGGALCPVICDQRHRSLLAALNIAYRQRSTARIFAVSCRAPCSSPERVGVLALLGRVVGPRC